MIDIGTWQGCGQTERRRPAIRVMDAVSRRGVTDFASVSKDSFAVFCANLYKSAPESWARRCTHMAQRCRLPRRGLGHPS